MLKHWLNVFKICLSILVCSYCWAYLSRSVLQTSWDPFQMNDSEILWYSSDWLNRQSPSFKRQWGVRYFSIIWSDIKRIYFRISVVKAKQRNPVTFLKSTFLQQNLTTKGRTKAPAIFVYLCKRQRNNNIFFFAFWKL